ncbi:MAG: glycoside hydrolase family 99-like domain-containing protein, partial [Thermoguttaceae bacterium]|nr:glycoside hydrolase family 99-like domain-containing protein [Thermoguttaceae bacterium]
RFREKTKAAGFPDLHLNAVYWGRPNIPGEATLTDPVKIIEGLGFDSVTSYVWIHHVPLNEQQTDFNWVRDEYLKHWDNARKSFSLPYIPNASVGWDSSPRACQDDPFGNWGYPFTNTISNNTPENFKKALEIIKERILADPECPRIMNINCWNEWTEGSYLEPDTVNGYKYLEAVRDVFGN